MFNLSNFTEWCRIRHRANFGFEKSDRTELQQNAHPSAANSQMTAQRYDERARSPVEARCGFCRHSRSVDAAA